MQKYIGFDIDGKKTIACVVQKGKKDKFTTLKTDIEQMKNFLQKQRKPGEKLHLTSAPQENSESPLRSSQKNPEV